jgi:GNAT superfamily N-acetyltransferase
MKLEVITWAEFQIGIAPLWRADVPADIPILNNPFNIIQYPLDGWKDRIVFFPCRLMHGDVPVAYTSIYNISDDVTRIRGIYVEPEYRGKGIGHTIWQKAARLFPEGFYRTVGFWREDSAPRFIQHSDMAIYPGTDWLWSDYSKVNMRMLYRDWGPRPNDLVPNQLFIGSMQEEFGIGGTNNLNRSWDRNEWFELAYPHITNYPDIGLVI